MFASCHLLLLPGYTGYYIHANHTGFSSILPQNTSCYRHTGFFPKIHWIFEKKWSYIFGGKGSKTRVGVYLKCFTLVCYGRVVLLHMYIIYAWLEVSERAIPPFCIRTKWSVLEIDRSMDRFLDRCRDHSYDRSSSIQNTSRALNAMYCLLCM